MKGYLLFWMRYLSEIFWRHFWDICILYSIFKIKFTAKPEKSQNFTSFRPVKGQKNLFSGPKNVRKSLIHRPEFHVFSLEPLVILYSYWEKIWYGCYWKFWTLIWLSLTKSLCESIGNYLLTLLILWIPTFGKTWWSYGIFFILWSYSF